MIECTCKYCGSSFIGYSGRANCCDNPYCLELQKQALGKSQYANQKRRRANPNPADIYRRCVRCGKQDRQCRCKCQHCGKPMFEQVAKDVWQNHVMLGPGCCRYDPLQSALDYVRTRAVRLAWKRRGLKIVRQVVRYHILEVRL